MSTLDLVKRRKRAIIDRHTRPDDVKALTQIATTAAPLAGLWYLAAVSAGVSYWLTAGIVPLISLFLLRAFVLMHDCGHGSLFRTARLNRAFGFLFGVVSAMPQYVWSQHHHYHHSTNGNWAKYRGPLNVCTAEDYAAMTAGQQRRYRLARSIWIVPVAGFLYLIFFPRYTWLKGTAGLVGHVVRGKIAQPDIAVKAHAAGFETPYWNSAREYRHMLWNNVALLSAWALMSFYIGPALFFTVYVASVSLAGGAGIVLFTVQHNFEHSYASGDEGWDYDAAAIHGTSFLILPRWLNWFTADIAYHHVHHLSARIPNYCLAECHEAHRDLFGDVPRVKLSHLPRAFKFNLWDTGAGRIISVEEHERSAGLETAA